MMAIRTDVPAAPPGLPVDRLPRRSWPWVMALCLLLALGGGAAYLAYGTSVLGVQTVAVSAAAGELPDGVRGEVVDAARMATGVPLLRVDLAAVRQRVLGVPEVAAASVSRHWPNELGITVTARTAVAMTKANGSLWLLDSTGVPYRKVEGSAPPVGLLTVDLATPRAGDPATMAGLGVVGSLQPPIRQQVVSVSAPSAYRVVLTLRDGRIIVWGSVEQGAKKMQILPALLAQPGSTYDISDPDSVAVS